MAGNRRKAQKRMNGTRYTDKQKLVAVETVRAAGGQVTDQTLADVRLLLRAPTLSLSTLDAWVKQARRQTDQSDSTEGSRKDESLPESKFDPAATAREMWRLTRIAYLERANDPAALLWIDGKDAVAAAERAQKMEQLLDGLPTEIIGVLPGLLELIRAKGYDPVATFATLETHFRALPDKPITPSHGAN
jgi:hypothetical protein